MAGQRTDHGELLLCGPGSTGAPKALNNHISYNNLGPTCESCFITRLVRLHYEGAVAKCLRCIFQHANISHMYNVRVV